MASNIRRAFLSVVLLALCSSGAIAQTTWAPGASSPINRYESPAVTLNGKVYIFGGFLNLTPTGVLETTPRVDVYDPAANTFTALAPIPAPASIPCAIPVTGTGVSHHGLALDGDKFVWVAGGFQGNDGGPAVANVWKYNIATNTWTAGPPLPGARGGGSLAVVGRKLHFLGGTMCDRNTDSADHWFLDLDAASPVWTVRAPMPNARNHASLAVVNGKIYAIGGQHNHDTNPIDVNNVDVYDAIANSWSVGAALPAVRSHFEPGTFVRDGRIVAVGGKSGNATLTDITEYDPINNSWTALTPLPTAFRAAVAQPVGSKIVVIGGGVNNGFTPTSATSIGTVSATNGSWSGSFAPLTPGRAETGVAAALGKIYVVGGHDANDALLNTVSVFDPFTGPNGTWSNIAPLPGPARDHIGVASVDGKIYAIGGLTGWPGPSVNLVYMYDPAAAAAGWVARASLPTARGAMGVAVINGKIYAAGGLNNSVDVATLTAYDPIANSWATLPSMPTNRDHLTAQAVDGKLYAIGGRHTQIEAVVGVTEVYDPTAGPNGTWSTKAPMLTPRGSVGSGVLGGRIFVFGADTGTSALNLNEEFDPATNSWRTVTPMITPRSSTSGTVLSGRIFAPGGKGADLQHNLTVNEAFVLGAAPPVGSAFLTQNGQVVMEAENAHGNISRGGKMWVSQTGPAGLVGSALQALPNSGVQLDTGYATTTAELQFQVQFPAAGTYHVWLRGYAANAQDNAAHVGVDGAAVSTSDRLTLPTFGAWTWFKSTMDGPVATVAIGSGGVHTINVWMREDGLYVDRVLLTTNASLTPTGNGPAESPRAGGGPTNQAPTANAGANQTVTLPAGVGLTGSATDDGLPAPPALTYTWSQFSGPGTTTFTPNAASTTATFSVAGVYVLRLSVSDGALTGTDDVQVTVNAGTGVTCAPSSNPTTLTFSSTVSGTHGSSGFNCFMPGTVPPSGANLAVNTASSHLVVTSTAGDLYQTVNTQENALGLQFANTATSTYSVRARIKGPFAPTTAYQSAGVYLALNTDNFAKLSVGQGSNGPRLEFGVETAATFGQAVQDTAFNLGDLDAASKAVDLWLVRKADGTIEALFRTITNLTTTPVLGPIVSLGTAAAPSWSGSSQLYGGLFDTHFGTTTAITATFDEFQLGPPVTPGGGNQAPGVNAGANQTVTLPAGASLSGSATDDGLPAPPALTYTWSQFSGPGTTTFTPNAASTTATFSVAGVYVLRLSVSDGALTGTDDVQVTVNAAGAAPFLVESGQVVMEAENAHANVPRGGKTWTPQTTPAGLVGSALQSLPNTGAQVDTGYTNTTAEVQYQVQFPAAGTYHVWLRGYAANSSDNAVHVGVDGAAVSTSDRLSLPTFGAWAWFKSTMDGPVATVTIGSAGVHTINVWMREDGLYIDRLLLTTDASLTPTGNGPAESPRVGGTGVTCASSSNPTTLTFSTPVAGTYGSSGFGCFMPGTVQPAGTNLAVNAGALVVTTAAGDLYQTVNTQENALGLQFANTGTYSVRARLKGPFTPSAPYQSAGVYLASNTDNFAKLSVGIGGSGPRLEFGLETAATFASAVPDTAFDLTSVDTASEGLDLWLVRNANGTIEALYRTITNLTGTPVLGTIVSLGTTSTVPSWSGSTPLYGGIVTTHFGTTSAITTNFDEFALGAAVVAGGGGGALTLTMTADEVQVGAPVTTAAGEAITFTRKVIVKEGTSAGPAFGIPGFDNPARVAGGPDGKLYVATEDGYVYVVTLDSQALTIPDAISVTHVQRLDQVFDMPTKTCNINNDPTNCQHVSGSPVGRQVTGLAIGPESTPTDIALYVTHGDPRIGDNNSEVALSVDPWSGTLTRIRLQPGLGGDYGVVGTQDLVVGLPRPRAGHGSNAIAFGPNRWLYYTVGATTNLGSSASINMLPESHLSASVMRLNIGARTWGSPAINVQTATQAQMAQFSGVLELFATGFRNGDGLVWHSNGQLYLNESTGNGGLGKTPHSSDGCTATASINPGTLSATLHRVLANDQGGQPNPAGGECVQNVIARDNPDLATPQKYRAPLLSYSEGAGASGIAEYTSSAFGGQLQGNLISVTSAGNQSVRRIVLNGAGTGVVEEVDLGTFSQPLDVTTDTSGIIYVAEHGADQITVLIPVELTSVLTSDTAAQP